MVCFIVEGQLRINPPGSIGQLYTHFQQDMLDHIFVCVLKFFQSYLQKGRCGYRFSYQPIWSYAWSVHLLQLFGVESCLLGMKLQLYQPFVYKIGHPWFTVCALCIDLFYWTQCNHYNTAQGITEFSIIYFLKLFA